MLAGLLALALSTPADAALVYFSGAETQDLSEIAVVTGGPTADTTTKRTGYAVVVHEDAATWTARRRHHDANDLP